MSIGERAQPVGLPTSHSVIPAPRTETAHHCTVTVVAGAGRPCTVLCAAHCIVLTPHLCCVLPTCMCCAVPLCCVLPTCTVLCCPAVLCTAYVHCVVLSHCAVYCLPALSCAVPLCCVLPRSSCPAVRFQRLSQTNCPGPSRRSSAAADESDPAAGSKVRPAGSGHRSGQMVRTQVMFIGFSV